MNGLIDGQKMVQMIKDEMMKIDRLCLESQNFIKDFVSINMVLQVYCNFGVVEIMRKNFEIFNERVMLVENMLREDDEDKENMLNLLLCYYEFM